MFSTFTGNSRRPRNVNLSGAVGNPFANTSWTPSNASSTTKTLSDAQADREKRQADRQRMRAASRIQRTWRGHKVRSRLADHRRAAFDDLYAASAPASSGDTARLHQAFSLLLLFCRPVRPDDLQRLLRYADDADNIDIDNINNVDNINNIDLGVSGLFPPHTRLFRIQQLIEIIFSALQSALKTGVFLGPKTGPSIRTDGARLAASAHAGPTYTSAYPSPLPLSGGASAPNMRLLESRDHIPQFGYNAGDTSAAAAHPFNQQAASEGVDQSSLYPLEPQSAQFERPPAALQVPLRLAARIGRSMPQALSTSREAYFTTLARICQRVRVDDVNWLQEVLNSLSIALQANPLAYTSFTSHFLIRKNLTLFETNIDRFAAIIDANQLGDAIADFYTQPRTDPPDELLWLLAHSIQLTNAQMPANAGVIRSVFIQLSALSSEISARVTPNKSLTVEAEDESDSSNQPSIDPYISRHLLWLISNEGTAKILRDFTASFIQPSRDALQGTSLLAGYLLTLLQSFPSNADDVRMRLFLEQVTSQAGPVPTIKFLWQMVQETTVFQSLRKESDQPLGILKNYLQPSTQSKETIEDQEWRIILLFLELYTFILRLSDDEDFFSGIYPSPLRDSSSLSRMQACSLSFEDVKSLTLFLKNIAFTLYYRGHEVSPARPESQSVAQSRLDSYFGADSSRGSTSTSTSATMIKLNSTKLDFNSLRDIISNAMTMLYERDSRKPFLPKDHWLVDRLQKEDLVSAVIAEEQRQRSEVSSDSENENDMEDNENDTDMGDNGNDNDMEDNGTPYPLTFTGRRHLSSYARVERLRAQQRRLQRERRLAELGPKLAVLKHMPFAVPFDTRVMIFRQFIELDMARRGGGPNAFPGFAKHAAQIRRGQLFEDAFEELYKIGDGLKDAIQITFVDKFDQTEAGIDGGGVTKEFLISVISEAFSDHDHGGTVNMFTSSPPGGLLYPNPTAIDAIKETMREGQLDESSDQWRSILNEQLKRYEFLGRILGKCMYEGILVDLNFAGFFLLKWPSSGPENHYKGSINDLRDMDEELYKGMLRLKNYPGDVSELGIDFTVTDQVSMPGAPIKTVTKLLVAHGDQLYVTNDNRPLYISYMARHRLVVQPALQTAAFLRGLRDIIRPSWLSMFNQSELQRLVGGDSSEINIDDLRRNTEYSGLYAIGDDKTEHPTIQLFWKVLRGFTDDQRRALLRYVSSTPRAPLLGFAQLRPLFSIRDAGTDEERLPSASTCVNLLKLPRYRTEETLREKLMYAITSGAGFDLS